MTDLRKAMEQALEALNNTHDVGCAETQDAITALREALTQPDVPEGYVLVPVEPTQAMFKAAFAFETQAGGIQGGDLSDAWAAMLAAAPKGGA